MTLPLVLLPGMMCDARLFAPQIAGLSEERDVTVPDISRHDSMEALAGEVLAEAPARFALGGLSMGGIVAMEVLRQAPARITGLALLDTNPLAETDAVKARRGPQIEAARAGRMEAVLREEMKPNYLTDGPNRQAILDLCMAMARDLGPEAFVRQSIALRERPDQSGTLARFDGPALILCGRSDVLCPVERHELMHRLMPGAMLCVIEDAGHMPTLERPDETTAALRRWLAQVDAG